jgi:tetratricopeptide (TPR) repeat protein
MSDDSVRAIFEEAVALHRSGEFDAAIELYTRALALRPDLWFIADNLCQALLASGNFAAGFALYDNRFHRPHSAVPRPTLPFPEWRGEPIRGRSVLVWPEQGYGDQIMFARFVPALANAGAAVTIAAPLPLAELLEPLGKIARIDELDALAGHDFWVSAASIPARLGVARLEVWEGPYLPCKPGGKGIGVASRGSSTPNPERSLDRESAKRLMDLPGTVSLLPEDTGADNFMATARIIEQLELVISVDTSIAHLSAAMGKETWILLPAFGLDWRWADGRTSPWYPDAQLFRQPTRGNWSPAIDAVLAALGRQPA